MTPDPGGAEIAEYVTKVRAALGLSPTQALVAIGIWLGLSEKQVAAWLGRAKPTIHTHIRAIYQRFDLLDLPHGQAAVARVVERAISATDSVTDETTAGASEEPEEG